MTAPVDLTGSPQNRTLPFVQVQSTGWKYITMDGGIREQFEIRSYGNTQDQATDNALLIEADMDSINGATLGSRTVDEVFNDGMASAAIQSPDGKEFFGFVTTLNIRMDHR